MLPFLNLSYGRLVINRGNCRSVKGLIPGAKLAGVSGFEPELSVLETDVLTVNTIPLQNKKLSYYDEIYFVSRCG